MKPFAHQEEAIDIGKRGPHAFFHDCGCGKTFTALQIIKYWKDRGIGPVIVVCPLSIIDAAWLEDCRKFTPELSIVSLHSDKPAERKKRLMGSYDIYVANFETFKSLFKEIQLKGFQVIIVDESSKMKCPTSQITRALLSMAGIAMKAKSGIKYPAQYIIPFRYILSGTPAPNSEDEYWSQTKFITGPGNNVFNDNFYAFRNRYFYAIPLGRTGQNIWKFRRETRPEFMDKLKEVAHVVRKEDAVDLPEQTHEKRIVILSPEEQKAYDTLKNDLVLAFANETILATSALVEVMKLRQITSGFLYGDVIHQIGNSKLNELKGLLEEIGDKQVIIWANFRHEIGQLLKELPSSDALWSGCPDRDKTIQGFQNKQYQYLIANPQSAAHGLTFTNCNYAVYFSLNYSYELQKQSQDRIHRIGQKWPCTYYYLIARGTVDEVIYKTVGGKAELSTEVLNYLRMDKNGNRNRQFQTA